MDDMPLGQGGLPIYFHLFSKYKPDYGLQTHQSKGFPLHYMDKSCVYLQVSVEYASTQTSGHIM